MDLLGQSQELTPPRKRVDGAIVFRRFTNSIQANGGDEDAYQNSIVEETRELFDCEVDELYQGTGAKRGRRHTLPQAAQEAYMVNESLSANELERLEVSIGGETQREVNERIQAVVKQQAKQTRKWLPW
ncbi:hypothetical protein Lepto7375DRAFT_0884 [Leptolyngbya sp. PCC 7375]|nr:hypothetical protein Lepto7375DRAFT_0884 [Leptolyngbya sp. PCC 7375]